MGRLKLTKLQEDILRFLFINTGKSFNARRMAGNLNVSQPAISKALPFLKKEGLIKLEKCKESKQLKIELNRENQRVLGLKRSENLKMFYESKIVQFLEDKFPGAVIILFGSYSFGDDYYNSDIDVAIVGCVEKDLNLEKFEKLLGKEIRINFYDNFKEIHENLRSSIFNGIVLVGEIKL